MGWFRMIGKCSSQFRLADHAACWIHAERLVHKLDSFNDDQRRAIEIERELIWWLYRDLKLYKEQPCRNRAAQLKARFKRFFSRKTGFAPLDRLLERLLDPRDDLLRVLDRPEIPLHTNGSENDIRCHVIKPKISGGTRSEAGRDARDACLGLRKHAKCSASHSSTVSAIDPTSKTLPASHRCQIWYSTPKPETPLLWHQLLGGDATR